MLNVNLITNLENVLVTEYNLSKNKEKVKAHYHRIILMIGDITTSKDLILTPRSLSLIQHLYSLTSKIDYIPSVYIKLIADLSHFLHILKIDSCFASQKHSLTIEFLAGYYKTVSHILKNQKIKKEKRETFEKIITTKLSNHSVNWLINNFLQPDLCNIDSNAKIIIKAITQSDFDFFETFAQGFKNSIQDIIINSTSKKYLNKYIFKVIEKCLIKLTDIEKDFMHQLSKICHNVIDLFLENYKTSTHIIKLFRSCLRIVYLIYYKTNRSNSKIIKFFGVKFSQLLKTEKEFIPIDVKEKVLLEFISVNIYTCKRKEKLFDYYVFIYELLMREQYRMKLSENQLNEESNKKFNHEDSEVMYYCLLECIARIFSFETNEILINNTLFSSDKNSDFNNFSHNINHENNPNNNDNDRNTILNNENFDNNKLLNKESLNSNTVPDFRLFLQHIFIKRNENKNLFVNSKEFILDSISKKVNIDVICQIISNSNIKLKISILDYLTFNHLSFFFEPSNFSLLQNLIESIRNSLDNPLILNYFFRFIEILFYHSNIGSLPSKNMLSLLMSIPEEVNDIVIFKFTLNLLKKFMINLQDNEFTYTKVEKYTKKFSLFGSKKKIENNNESLNLTLKEYNDDKYNHNKLNEFNEKQSKENQALKQSNDNNSHISKQINNDNLTFYQITHMNNREKLKTIIGLVKILTLNSNCLKYIFSSIIDRQKVTDPINNKENEGKSVLNFDNSSKKSLKQEILNQLSILIIMKVFNPDLYLIFNLQDMIKQTELNKSSQDLAQYLLLFSLNLPPLLFNKNSSFINPINIEIYYNTLKNVTYNEKLFYELFNDLPDKTLKSSIKEQDFNMQMYFFIIYYCFSSKITCLSYYLHGYEVKNYNLEKKKKKTTSIKITANSNSNFKSYKKNMSEVAFDSNKYSIKGMQNNNKSEINTDNSNKQSLFEEIISNFNENCSVVLMIDYLNDNIFLLDEKYNNIFNKLFDNYAKNYIDLLKKLPNTYLKQQLLRADMKILLNNSCSYHVQSRKKSLELINIYAEVFPFLLNDFEIFEYYAILLGVLSSSSMQPFNFYVKGVLIDSNPNNEEQIKTKQRENPDSCYNNNQQYNYLGSFNKNYDNVQEIYKFNNLNKSNKNGETEYFNNNDDNDIKKRKNKHNHSSTDNNFFKVDINQNNNNIIELPSEEAVKEKVYGELSKIFETGIQKSHIINNNNIAYNMSNFVNKCTYNTVSMHDEAKKYSLNIMQKIYNNIKKIEISSFLKTTAYLEPKNFEDYLKKNVYKNFDKYLAISAISDLHNFTDYAKASILQLRNKYMGIVEGKVNSLLHGFKNDDFYYQLQQLKFSYFGSSVKNKGAIVFDYIYYQIIRDYMIRIDSFVENINKKERKNKEDLIDADYDKFYDGFNIDLKTYKSNTMTNMKFRDYKSIQNIHLMSQNNRSRGLSTNCKDIKANSNNNSNQSNINHIKKRMPSQPHFNNLNLKNRYNIHNNNGNEELFIKQTSELDIYSLLIEMTSFLVYSDINNFTTSFNKQIITDEAIKIISSIPIFLFSTKAIDCGVFCWEWILYFNNSSFLVSLLSNMILAIKSYKEYVSNNYYLMKNKTKNNKESMNSSNNDTNKVFTGSEIFDPENSIKSQKNMFVKLFFTSTINELEKDPLSYNIYDIPISNSFGEGIKLMKSNNRDKSSDFYNTHNNFNTFSLGNFSNNNKFKRNNVVNKTAINSNSNAFNSTNSFNKPNTKLNHQKTANITYSNPNSNSKEKKENSPKRNSDIRTLNNNNTNRFNFFERGQTNSTLFNFNSTTLNLNTNSNNPFSKSMRTSVLSKTNTAKFQNYNSYSNNNKSFNTFFANTINNNSVNNKDINDINFNFEHSLLNLVNIFDENFSITNTDLNDYILSQIKLLKFIKECMNEICKTDIQKLTYIFEIMKLFIDLNFEKNVFSKPPYIYLHFLVMNISLELIHILEDKCKLLNISHSSIYEFRCLIYLFGFKYFEFNKVRRMIKHKVFLSEIEQTLICVVEMIIKDTKKFENFEYSKIKSTMKKKQSFGNTGTNNNYYTINERLNEVLDNNANNSFQFNGNTGINNNNSNNNTENSNINHSFLMHDNIKNLLAYLIESEISNLRYWNSPSTFHDSQNKNNSSLKNLSNNRLKELFESAFLVSNRLSLKLIQRFPWIEKKFESYVKILESKIYNSTIKYLTEPQALKYYVDYIIKNKLSDLNYEYLNKFLLLWKLPNLNFGLKYLSLEYKGFYSLHKFATRLLSKASKSTVIFYMPELIQSLRTDTNGIVEKFILDKSRYSPMIAHQFIWSLEVEEIMGPKAKQRFLPKHYKDPVFILSKVLRETILKNFNPMERKIYYDVNKCFLDMGEISGSYLHLDENPTISLKDSKEEKTEFVLSHLKSLPSTMSDHIYLPTNPDTRLIEMLPNTCKTLQSAKKVPFEVSFLAKKYYGPDFDSLITETNICDYISNQAYQAEYELITKKGLIGFVSNTKSLNMEQFTSTQVYYNQSYNRKLSVQFVRNNTNNYNFINNKLIENKANSNINDNNIKLETKKNTDLSYKPCIAKNKTEIKNQSASDLLNNSPLKSSLTFNEIHKSKSKEKSDKKLKIIDNKDDNENIKDIKTSNKENELIANNPNNIKYDNVNLDNLIEEDENDNTAILNKGEIDNDLLINDEKYAVNTKIIPKFETKKANSNVELNEKDNTLSHDYLIENLNVRNNTSIVNDSNINQVLSNNTDEVMLKIKNNNSFNNTTNINLLQNNNSASVIKYLNNNKSQNNNNQFIIEEDENSYNDDLDSCTDKSDVNSNLNNSYISSEDKQLPYTQYSLNNSFIRNNGSIKNVNNALKNKTQESEVFKISCIFKVGDDLRQDSLALQIIHIFKEIFSDNKLDLYLFPYKTISSIYSKHKDLGGMIEVVPNCDSRDQIGKTYGTNLYEYYLGTFGHEDGSLFREARKNFIESLAAYSVVSYILQIKDRHNGNILIDKVGHLIHIDFGFIFDISPAGNLRFEKPGFKLTLEMVKIMGGKDTEAYNYFVELAIRGFLAARDNIDKLIDPVVLMFNSGLECFRNESIKRLIERFKLELNEDEAALFYKNQIEYAYDNWRTNVYDWIQSKQNQIHY